jgi:tRNA U55 pseudouridine synthase TruB
MNFFLGYTTDTYDILGIVKKNIYQNIYPTINLEIINSFQSTGTFSQPFPMFSSRKFNGKPLFVHAYQQQITPSIRHDVNLYKYCDYACKEITYTQLLDEIKKDCNAVMGDFRQEHVINQWEEVIGNESEKIIIHSLTMKVSSGFYVRQWVNDFGGYLSTGAVTFSITRGTIGMFNVSMLNGEAYRIFEFENFPINDLTNYNYS